MKFPSLSSMFDVYRQGGSVADAVMHRNTSALGVALGALIFTLAGMAKNYGLDLSFITPEVAGGVGVFLAGVFGMHWRYATSADRGLPGLAPVADAPVARPAGDGAASGNAQPASPVGSVATDAGPSGEVRSGPSASAGPTGDFMP